MVPHTAGGEMAKILASSYAKIIMCHDRGDYEELRRESRGLSERIRVARPRVEEAASLVAHMYSISDEADRYLRSGDLAKHSEIFSLVFQKARLLDQIVGIRRGSLCDEIHWWYHYRLSRSGLYHGVWGRIKGRIHFLLAVFFIVYEHARRLRRPIEAILCTLYLVKAGRLHEKRRWGEVESILSRYWLNKIKGNGMKIDPNLMLI